jgi:glutathione S-transferase
MPDVTLYGPNWSAYTRTARLVLIEKDVEHELVEVDFSNGVMPEDHLNRHPFGKVPVLRHEKFLIYETSAICRYIDAAFSGPALQPSAAQSLGRMAQIIAILDAYISEEIRMGFVNERLIKPMMGLSVDIDREESARSAITKAFSGLCACIGERKYLVGDQLSLADLHAAPLFDYLARTPGGSELIDTQPRLREWWSGIETRPSIVNTQPDLSAFSNPRN